MAANLLTHPVTWPISIYLITNMCPVTLNVSIQSLTQSLISVCLNASMCPVALNVLT